MTQKRYTEIPKRQKCINKEEPYIGGAEDIIDDELNKTQSQVNNEVLTEIGADNVPNSIKGRVKGLEDQVGEGGTVDERIAAAVAPKANSSDVYAKTETYNKTELNNMITTPNQEYVTVTATDQTTAATDVLPASGEADTVYRVGNWDGSQYDTTTYTEYAWNGSIYVLLNTKEYGIDDVPTANSENLVKSGGVFNSIPQKANLQTDKEGYHVIDTQGNIGMQYTEEGFNAAKVQKEFIKVLKDAGINNEVKVIEEGFFFVDESLCIGVSINNEGIRAKNIPTYETREIDYYNY